MKIRLKIRLLHILFFVFLFSEEAFAAQNYEFTDIGALLGVGKNSSTAGVVNNHGNIAGPYELWHKDGYLSGRGGGFIYRPGQGVELIDSPQNDPVWIHDMNDKDQFITGERIYSNGWLDGAPLSSLHSINNLGDVLGLIEVQRGQLGSSVAIRKEDGSVIDLLQGVEDCDSIIAGDCDGENRLDFDKWLSIHAGDMNDKGEVVFYLRGEAHKIGGKRGYNVYDHMPMVYIPGQGVEAISPNVPQRYARLEAVINNSGSALLSYRTQRSGEQSIYLYSMGDHTLTADLINLHGFYNLQMNDSNVIAGGVGHDKTSIAFSTDGTDLVNLDFNFSSINDNNTVVGSQSGNAVMYAPISQREIKIDGAFGDWSGLPHFADSVGDGGLVDWDKVWVDGGNGHLSFSYSLYRQIDLTEYESQLYLWNIYLDSDRQESTGYSFGLLGADYLIQGRNLYQYTGTGQDWAWTYLGDVDYASRGSRAELSMAKSRLGLPEDASSYRALFYGTDPDDGRLDYMLVDIIGGDGNVILQDISLSEG